MPHQPNIYAFKNIFQGFQGNHHQHNRCQAETQIQKFY